jgi:protein SCO1/2
MAKNSPITKAVLIIVLVLPSVFYFIFVYGAEGNFFQKLAYVGPTTVVDKVQGDSIVKDTLAYVIPDFEFTSQDDTTLSAQEMRGKIYVANFFFSTCPTICPAMNYNLKQVQDRFLGYEDIYFLSFTVDPEYDSVPVLKAYEKRIGAAKGRWFFLTGAKKDLYKTAGDFFLSAMEDDAAAGGFLHSEQVVLVDWEGRIRSRIEEDGNLKAVYSATSPAEVGKLKDDIKVLIAEYEKHKSVSEYQASKKEK